MAVNQDQPQQEHTRELIRVTPGGMVSSVPAHAIGLRGSTPSLTSANVIDGFKNLVSLNGETAVPFLNSTSDSGQLSGSLLLGNTTPGGQDIVNVQKQNLLSQIFSIENRPSAAYLALSSFNGEVVGNDTTGSVYGALQEPFTAAGTVTVAAGSPNVIVGAGTTWTTDVLTGGYLANKSLDFIIPGDVIGVGALGSRIWFRIIKVTDNTHLTVFPAVTAGNPAIGAGKAYVIQRTGYGGYSRSLTIFNAINVATVYSCGGSHNGVAAGDQAGHGTIEAFGSSTTSHQMAPRTVDAVGATTAFPPRADDIAYYKGFLLYGAGSAVSWSVAGFPTASPFGATDFPAANITVVDITDRFVTFEYIGDQPIAIFERSMWLVSSSGSVPEFNFYRMPETLGVIHPSADEPCGIPFAAASPTQNQVYGRPSTTGRGGIFYMSDRGIEHLSGGLAVEASVLMSTALANSFGLTELSTVFLSWSDDFDLLLWRPAWGTSGNALVYNPQSKDWSIFNFSIPGGYDAVIGITGGVSAYPTPTDRSRKWHIGYSTTGTVTGQTWVVKSSPDLAGNYPGLGTWKWRTPVIPLGLHYPSFSLAGFMPDLYTAPGVTTTVTWTMFGGSSPYNMVQRDSGTLTLSATGTDFPTPWTTSRARLGKKIDDGFVCFELSSGRWASIAGIILFNAPTQVQR